MGPDPLLELLAVEATRAGTRRSRDLGAALRAEGRGRRRPM